MSGALAPEEISEVGGREMVDFELEGNYRKALVDPEMQRSHRRWTTGGNGLDRGRHPLEDLSL